MMSGVVTLIRNAGVLDGTGAKAEVMDVALGDERIAALGPKLAVSAEQVIDAEGLMLAPGFIDTHTHDDLAVIRDAAMMPKVSQGVTTVIVGNCGISASPARVSHRLPDPMNLLGTADAFGYATFGAYVNAV